MKNIPIIFFLAVSIALFVEPVFAENSSSECAEIIKATEGYYARIQTMECKYKKSIFSSNGEPNVTLARVFYKRPAKIKIDNIEPVRLSYICNGKYAWLYNQDKNTVEKRAIDENMEQVVGVQSLLLINPFSNMHSGYTFERIEDFQGSIVLKAVPEKKDGYVSMVLVKIDPEDKRALASEIFDKSGRLMSQTKYSDYRESGDGIAYPHHIETSLQSAGQRAVREVIEFERVFINVQLSDSMFEFKASNDTVFIDETVKQ